MAAGEGRLLFATTNHRDRLDPAFTRPGRIDRQIEIGYADRDQLRRLFLRFFDDCDPTRAENFANHLPDYRLAMSSVQTYLIELAHSPDAACAHIDDWLAEQLASPDPLAMPPSVNTTGDVILINRPQNETWGRLLYNMRARRAHVTE